MIRSSDFSMLSFEEFKYGKSLKRFLRGGSGHIGALKESYPGEIGFSHDVCKASVKYSERCLIKKFIFFDKNESFITHNKLLML